MIVLYPVRPGCDELESVLLIELKSGFESRGLLDAKALHLVRLGQECDRLGIETHLLDEQLRQKPACQVYEYRRFLNESMLWQAL